MATRLDICNYALSLLGEERINSIDETEDTSMPATLCRLYLQQAIDTVLYSSLWNCAIERDTINALSSAPIYEYTYKLPLPNDPYCLRIIEVENNKYINWEQEGRYILCNEPTLNIKFIKRVEDVSIFDPLLIQCIYYLLASQLCIPLMKESSFRQRLLDEYYNIIKNSAIAINSMQNNKVATTSTWLESLY